MAKIFVTRKIPDIGLQMLRDKGFELDVSGWDHAPSKDELIAAFKGTEFDGAITLLTDIIDKDVLDAAPTVKVFANYAIGFNNFDLEEAKKRGVIMTNTPGNSFSFCIAEHAMALMLALSTRIVEADKYVRDGKFQGWDPNIFVGTDLKGKKLGLLGVGQIGAQVAQHAAQGFNMEVDYYDVKRNEQIEKDFGAKFFENPDEVIKNADFLSIHVPLLDSTHHMINADRLKMMKPTAFLINTSRGPVVDENALVAALKAGTIRGAGLDVFEFEPKLAEGLSALSNVVLTPHIASARESARDEMARLAAQSIIDVLEGREPVTKVNK